MEEDDNERTIELSSIAAIFPEIQIEPSNPYVATLEVVVKPEKSVKIYFQAPTISLAPPTIPAAPITLEHGSDSGYSSAPLEIVPNVAQPDVHELAYLPPVNLRITLPDDYPSQKPPSVAIDVSPQWLDTGKLKELESKCAQLWEEYGRDQIVYTYIDYVQQAAEEAFGINKDPSNTFHLSSDLKLALLDFDLKSRRDEFERETFNCGVCFEPKKGKDCHRLLLCGHVFCVACLQDFFNNCIDEGDVDNVKCIDPSCGKDLNVETTPTKTRKINRSLNPSELLQIPITQDRVQRYVRLKRKAKLEADKTTVYCPRQWCQGAARSKKHPKPADLFNDFDESGSDNEKKAASTKKRGKKKSDAEDIPMAERLSICEDCNYAFCCVCFKGWHGEMARCNPRRQAELNAEEKASLEYLQRYSTACPTCNAPAQKTHGCNHMICFKCKTHFCYLCSAYLMPDNPFRHFNDFKSNCYQRLWVLEGGDGADVEIAIDGGPPPFELEESESDDESLDEEEEDMADFDGDDLVDWDADSDTEDDEPAPDQRRPDRPHIEILNFARGGAAAPQRIELPNQPRNEAVPPPAPAPPRRRGRNRGRGQVANRQLAMGNEPHQNHAAIVDNRAPAVANVVQIVQPGVADRPLAAPGQGDNLDQALQRFLLLAQQDREDEWDSDD